MVELLKGLRYNLQFPGLGNGTPGYSPATPNYSNIVPGTQMSILIK